MQPWCSLSGVTTHLCWNKSNCWWKFDFQFTWSDWIFNVQLVLFQVWCFFMEFLQHFIHFLFNTLLFSCFLAGIITVVLLVFLCTIAVLLWCLSRQKGSYVTNETEDDDEEDNEDDESVGSDVALQSKEPLKTDKEDWRGTNVTST